MLQGQEMKRRMSPLGASFGSGHSSDSAAMASGSPDVATNQEPAEVQEDCSGKKKSKFQTFKKLFARKKRKEPQNAGVEEGLKGSQSSDNVSKTSENNTLTRSEKEKGSGSRISLGNKALSHDSVFVSDSSEANEGLGASQDSIHGKVKSLQLQLKQAIRLGSPPSLMCVKKTEDAGATSEDDGLPCSPPDYTPLHSVKSKAERSSSNSLHGVDGDEQLSGRALSPPAVPGDFSQPASPFVCLDNSAAKHKLGLRNKACNRRKPARRLELKAEGESTAEEEELTVSLTAADVTEEQQKAEVESRDQLKAETEEEEDEEDKPQKDSAAFPLGGSDGEDDAEAEQDVSHAPDASCPPESGFSEEEEEEEEEDEEEQDASVDRRAPSSSSGSTSSSLDSPSVSPEPPAGQTEHLTSPAGFCCAVHSESDSLTGEEENVDEGSSLLEEVLSSLKTSHSPDVEVSGVVMETEETEDEAVEVDERKEEEDPTGCEGPALSPDTSDRTAQEEEEEEEEEEAVEVKEEPEAVDEKCQNEVEEREEGSCVEVEEVRDEEEAEEEAEAEDEEEMTEGIPDAEDEEDPTASSILEEGEGDDDATLETDDQILPEGNEEQEVLNENSGAEEEEEEEVELQDRKSEDVERSPDGNQSGDDVELGKDGTSPLIEEKEAEAEEEGCVSSRLPPLLLPESRSVSCSDQSPTSSPSKTSTLHIHLASPTSEKPSSLLQLTAVTEPLSPAEKPTEFNVTERIEGVKKTEEEEEEEEKQSAPEPGDSSGQESPSTPTDQSKVRFTVAPAWQRLQSHPTSPSAAPALWDSRAEVETADRKERNVKAEPGSPAEGEAAPSPLRGRSSGSFTSKPQSYAASAPAEAQTALPGRTPESAAVAEANPDSPFGVRLRKTSALLRLGSEEVESEPQVESPTHPPSAKVESPQPISSKPPASHPIGNKPALPRKPEVHGDAGVKPRRISEPPPARSAPGGSDSPSWISVAKQKQKVYKETPLNEITVKKEEQEKKPALPPSREQSSSSSKPLEPTSRVSVEKETRRTFSVPTPVPPQPPKPLLQKPQAPPTPAKPSPRPDSPRSSPAKPPPVLSKTPPVASPRTVPEKPASPQRGSPPATLPQNEPPWMALAKKKAKAWSEMPQIVQ
ncbi:PREDICTED: histone-lysine N-methyltransferase SETD1B-like isoform X6 [Poecilia mexicana]|uniref:histone-lysine N-methyltransferase SETD1B-like isoform X6 n=1 Tax=Poecilia mexicana TaxID=48701 RepID=UPI00072E8DD4|nr:PREDICTED: histone-lysine N-methyltransferase SETD1B-like isoform X6 [Poecilia mexicana]